MASSSNNNTMNFTEGASTTRPPLYAGTNYNYWKTRMLNYLLAVDLELYFVITKGPKILTKKDSNNKDVPKL